MKSQIHSSKRSDATQAVSEATSGISRAKGILFLSDYARLSQFSKLLKAKYPDAQIIGTAGTVYHNTVIDDQNILIVIAIIDEAELSANVIGNLSTDPLSDMYKLSESVKVVSAKKNSTVCVEFCTVNEEVLVSSMNVILAPAGIKLAGGTVFGAPEGKASLVAYNGEVYEDACVYMVIRNTTGKACVIKENIYDKADGPAHVATKVNAVNKELIELDHRPAADVYSKETGVSKSGIVDNVMQAPFGRIIDDEIYISSMNGVTGYGSITNYKRINQNDALYILKLMDYRRINEDTCRKIKSFSSKPSMVIAVNCIYRYLLFQQEGYLGEFLTNMSKLAPFSGYIGGGEQYN